MAEGRAPSRLEGKYIAIIVCWLLGNGCLFSWNSMLTIGDYYAYLFPKYHPARVLTLVYQPFALGTIAILAYHEAKINTRKRNLFGYSLFFISTFLVLVIWPRLVGEELEHTLGYAQLVVLLVLQMLMFRAVWLVIFHLCHLSWFSLVQTFQSFLAGLAASGALTSGLRLITKAIFDNSKDGFRKGAILFFSISTIFELLCLILYALVFPKLPIVKYYRNKAALEGSKTVAADLAAGGVTIETPNDPIPVDRLSIKELLMQNIDYALDIFMIYVLTLSIFPGFLSEDTGSHSLGSWYALVLIAMYNVWDLIGRYVPLLKWVKLESRKGIMVAILLRYLLIPAFYFTAKYGDQGWMIILTSFLGLTNGYLTVCVFTSAPKGYKGPEQNALGNILVFFLLGGIFAGVTLDWLWLIGKGW
ncbi:equilibrative nucleotide transporter 3-like isoform X1 [Ipomoea triloba]|uniref:equilibrative nucleotide transporter 3-like isoform X1 n=1 Tax=Ipomoea triloba TaxID=35885 RepID=UPI00125E5795|nr:equilibrative nucleotide transporter 3-like isoform X1 [Ipomoea triloba]